MNNIKVLEHALKDTETGDSDTWQKLQTTLFLDLIKMRQKAWSKMVDEMAIDASRAESYEPSGMVEAFEKKVAHDGFYSELRNPEGDNVAECADRALVACLRSSWRTRAALRSERELSPFQWGVESESFLINRQFFPSEAG